MKTMVEFPNNTYLMVSKKDYQALYENDRLLCALQAAGVDNWDGYNQAIDILEDWDKEELENDNSGEENDTSFN